ncbi:hypothetical protein ACROYT_G043823 [Oculina patagonica]
MAWENRGHRTCVLDGERAQYLCQIGEHSVENGNFHNVYIRLKAQKHGAGEMYYYVVFNGFHVTEQKITSYSKNDKKLRVLAKRLAENLNLNYFDVKANSKDRILYYSTTILQCHGPRDCMKKVHEQNANNNIRMSHLLSLP